jgi:hypothetical protein
MREESQRERMTTTNRESNTANDVVKATAERVGYTRGRNKSLHDDSTTDRQRQRSLLQPIVTHTQDVGRQRADEMHRRKQDIQRRRQRGRSKEDELRKMERQRE